MSFVNPAAQTYMLQDLLLSCTIGSSLHHCSVFYHNPLLQKICPKTKKVSRMLHAVGGVWRNACPRNMFYPYLFHLSHFIIHLKVLLVLLSTFLANFRQSLCNILLVTLSFLMKLNTLQISQKRHQNNSFRVSLSVELYHGFDKACSFLTNKSEVQ
jgi:hypothetical protein